MWVFYRLLSKLADPYTPERASALRFQGLHVFHGLRLFYRGSTLSCPFRIFFTMRQDSLDVTAFCLLALLTGVTLSRGFNLRISPPVSYKVTSLLPWLIFLQLVVPSLASRA
jgi:hypothetical protein